MSIGKSSRPSNIGIGDLANGSAKFPLSSSVGGISNGNPSAVLDAATGVGYTPVHTFSLGVIEELYLWAANKTSAAAKLTMSFGDSSFASNNIIVAISGETGLNLVYPGVPHLGNTTNTQTLYVRASAASSLTVSGFVVRSYPFNSKDSTTYGYYNAEDD